MNNNFKFDYINKQDYCSIDGDNAKYDIYALTEVDFYSPSDNRVLESYIEDIDGGDNFVDYCAEFFELLEEEGYYD